MNQQPDNYPDGVSYPYPQPYPFQKRSQDFPGQAGNVYDPGQQGYQGLQACVSCPIYPDYLGPQPDFQQYPNQPNVPVNSRPKALTVVTEPDLSKCFVPLIILAGLFLTTANSNPINYVFNLFAKEPELEDHNLWHSRPVLCLFVTMFGTFVTVFLVMTDFLRSDASGAVPPVKRKKKRRKAKVITAVPTNTMVSSSATSTSSSSADMTTQIYLPKRLPKTPRSKTYFNKPIQLAKVARHQESCSHCDNFRRISYFSAIATFVLAIVLAGAYYLSSDSCPTVSRNSVYVPNWAWLLMIIVSMPYLKKLRLNS